MEAAGNEKLSVSHVGTEGTQVEVIGKGMQVEEDLDVIHLVQE